MSILKTSAFNSTKEEKGKSPGVRLSYFFAGLILILITIPSFQAIFGYHLLRYVAPIFIFWLLIIQSETPRVLLHVIRNRIGELVIYGYWCVVVMLYALFVPDGVGLNPLMGNASGLLYSIIMISICYVIGMVYASKNDRQANRWLMKLLFVAFGLNAFLSLRILLSTDLAVRASIDSYQAIEGGQISISIFAFGGLGFYAAEALSSIIFLTIGLEAKGFIKFVFLCLYVAIAINIILSTLLVVQIGFVLGVALFLLHKITQPRTTWRFRFGLLVLIGILSFVGFRLSGTRSVQYSLNRLPTLVGQKIDPSIEGNTTEKRIERYSASINSFIKNPILGISFTKFIGSDLSNQWIGGHSGILDGLAMYGLLPFSLLIIFLWIKYRHLRNMLLIRKQDEWISPLLICFIIYLFEILFDPLLFNSSVSGLFLFAVIGYAAPIQRNDILKERFLSKV